MKQMLKKLAAFVTAMGLTVSISTPAMANQNIDLSLGPGYVQYLEEQGMKEEILPMPGNDESAITAPIETAPTETAPEESTPEESAPTESTPEETAPTESTAAAETPVTETPVENQTQGSGGLIPNTVKYGGHVDITPTNEAAIWDAVEVNSTPAEKPGQLIWVSAKLKDGFNGKLSYRPYVNNGGWLKFYNDGQPAGGTEGSTYVQAIQMHLTGEAASQYDLYYAVSTYERGQLGFAKEGAIAGAMNVGDWITDLKVVLVPKGTGAPASTADRFFNEFSGRIGFTETAAYCVNEDGTPYTGWAEYDGRQYYFKDGLTLSGWHYIDGLKFFFEENGVVRQDVDSLIGKQDSYHIMVNKALNCLTVYAKDGENGYIIPVKAMLTSVGDDTPLGTFTTPEKYRWRLMVNDTWTQYATRIKAGEGFLFHSITYEETDPMTLITSGYNGLGVSRSLGCVRLTCENAKWIYDNCAIGTQVTIYEDWNQASPLIKPYVILIPDDQTYDPSDPNVKLQ